MSQSKIILIAAIGKNRELGKNGKIPWHIPEDLKHFKERTFGSPVIMGRKTFESIGKPLPGRKNIIITRNLEYKAPERCFVVQSLEEAIDVVLKDGPKEIFVIGGAEIFNLAMERADMLILTHIESEFEADAYFPDYSKLFKVLKCSKEKESSGYNFKICEYERDV
jgi:dihydrofolate reductase